MATVYLTASFGPTKGGLDTVGYAVKDKTGQVLQARTTTGVVDLGNGFYGAPVTLFPQDVFLVCWDTGDQNPRTSLNTVTAVPDSSPMLESIKQEVQGLKAKNNRRVPDDPRNPTQVHVDVKRDSAPTWAPENLQESYDVKVSLDGRGGMVQHGG